jgi:hypothetical protein
MPLISDDRLKKVNDLLLSSGRGIELAAHLGKPLVDMVTEVTEVMSEVDEVLSKSVETPRRGLAELAELAAELADITVGGTCEDTSGRGVLLTCPHPPRQVVHPAFKRGDA